jgi:periplasmic protein TonB
MRIGIAITLGCLVTLGSQSVQAPQEKPNDTQQSGPQENFVRNPDYELKIDQGQFLVRQRGTENWKQSSSISDVIVIGNLEGVHKVYLNTRAIKPPKATHVLDPQYPDGEKKSGKQGSVVLHVIVDDHGIVQSPIVDASPGPAFSAAAREALKKWTFKPAKLNDVPVAVLITVSINFRLY